MEEKTIQTKISVISNGKKIEERELPEEIKKEVKLLNEISTFLKELPKKNADNNDLRLFNKYFLGLVYNNYKIIKQYQFYKAIDDFRILFEVSISNGCENEM